MFGRRPRFDDTFGVRMDLGADRMDPMSLRPSSHAGQLRVKAPVLVKETRSFFGLFARRNPEPLAQLDQRQRTVPTAMQIETVSSRAAPGANADGLRQFESRVRGAWKKMSVQQRIWTSVIAGWILIASGMFIPAIVIAGIYIAVRRRAA